jgi:8-oxo-dGTP pyrophosphatase MutT (NUDIX family)
MGNIRLKPDDTPDDGVTPRERDLLSSHRRRGSRTVRLVVDCWAWELPGGRVDPYEDPAVARWRRRPGGGPAACGC